MKNLILASTSIYRAQLLEKLGLSFQSIKSDFDEDAAKTENLNKHLSPIAIAENLSRGKALSLRRLLNSENLLIIGGDQLVNLDGEIIGKSKTHEKAVQQLQKMRGKTHELITAVTLVSEKEVRHINHITRLTMHRLSDQEIQHYLLRDQAYDCAGSYKIEKSGIALFSQIECSDFSAIQGLPLIWLSNQLKEMGYELFEKTNE